jgi:uncharacterized protein YndB with AHSA1/START domain
MTDRSTVHGTFTIERVLDATPTRVFAAWADPEAKAQWFAGPPDVKTHDRVFDFRVGGRDRLVTDWPNGVVSRYDAIYLDIVPDRRIITAYEMHLNDRKISASLATVWIEPAGKGTRLVLTEQGAFLDGYDDSGSRERGTNDLVDKLVASLRR